MCKKYDFVYDRNEYRIKYVYVQTSREKKLSEKKCKARSLGFRLSDEQREYFGRVADINMCANFLQNYVFLTIIFHKSQVQILRL